MPTIDRPGASVYYEANGTGPALLLGHSLLLDGRMWDPVLPGLSRIFRCINVDARSHRRSTASGRFTLDDLASDWLAILDRENIPRAFLCGLSMGGMTAMRLALRHPDRVAAMALLDTSADPEPRSQRVIYRALGELQRAVRMDFLVIPIIERKMFAAATRRDRPDLVDRVIATIREKHPRVLYPALRAVFDRDSIADRLSSIRCPVAVLCGEEDAATSPTRSRRIAERIPGATLHMLPGAGHLSVIERPSDVETRLIEFFVRHAALAA